MAEGAAVGLAVNVGAEALGALDKWLDGKRKAQSWFGDRYRTFTNIRWYKLNFSRISLFPHHIRQVFVINRDDWRLVLTECLNAASRWDSDSLRRENGECCWMHIYRTIGHERAKRFLIKRNDSGSHISSVATIPAARVESWGLFVLAYANGARLTQRQRTSDGSLRITLPCRDFIITILRQGATGPISTHLEPRTRSIDTYKPFRPDQWTNLLEQGYSYNEFDPRF